MKKNFKFMLVALLAVFGFGNAMADELVGSTQYTNDGYQYKIKTINASAKTGTVSVRSTNWTVGNADQTKISIKSAITLNVKGEISSTPFEGVVNFNIVEIEADGFKNLGDVTSIEFAEPCNVNTIGAGAFAGTKIADLNLTKTKITKLEKLFEDANTTLASVELPATLTEVANSALEHCYVLANIDLSLCTQLLTLGQNCFGDNIVTKLDLSKTIVKSLANKPFVGHGGSGEKNKTLKELVLPTTINDINVGLANLYNLESVNLQDITQTAFAVAESFENDRALKSLKFPVTTTAITGNEIFKGCESLETIEIPYDNLITVGTAGQNFFAEADAPVVSGDKSLSALKTLKFTTTNASTYNFSANIVAGFGNCKGITFVSIAPGDIISGTLSAGAIALSNEANSTVVLGNLTAAPDAGFIEGPTAAAYETTVTIGVVSAAQTQTAAIISGNLGTVTVNSISANVEVIALGQAKKLVFGGNISGALTANTAPANGRLTEIDFGEIQITDAADKVPATAFDENNAPNLAKVTWTPKFTASYVAPTNLIFNQKAFGTASVNAAAKITFETVTEVAALYPSNVTEPAIVDPDLYNVIFKFTAAVEDPELIKVAGKDGGSVFVGKFFANGSNYKIAKEQDGAIITVYSAFVDASDNKIYMDPLMIVDGNFIVEADQAVVVRSTKSDDVKTYKTTDDSTMRYDKTGATLFNDLLYTSTAISADKLGTDYYDKGQNVYNLDNPKTTGGISFTILGTTQYLPAKSIYVVTEGTSAARLQVVWLDGSDATAIESLIEKKGAEKANVIYNLAGQKVDANYKGIVIKNGKKMIQK